MLDQHPLLIEQVLIATGAKSVAAIEQVQSLWSGYGQIARCHLQYNNPPTEEQASSVIVKLVQPPAESHHPRGWNTNASTQRKLTLAVDPNHWTAQG